MHSAPAATEERKLRSLLDGVDANLWIADPKTLQRTFVSLYAEELLGYPVKRWLTEPGFWRNSIHSADRQKTLEAALAAVAKADRFVLEYRLVAADGRTVWVRDSMRVERDGRGRPVVLRGAMVDITALHEATEALRRSEERMRLLIENARDYGIFSVDTHGRITTWNSGAQALTGYTELEALGKPVGILFTPEDNEHGDAMNELQRALTTGRAINERWHLHKSGRRFWGSGLVMAVKDSEGKVIGAVKIVRDATEQRRAADQVQALNSELELRVQERTAQLEASNRELESFSYSVSHDLHAPLRKIDGYSLILQQDYGRALGGTGGKHLAKIREASQQMSRLIDDLLHLARVVRGTMRREQVDLGALAQSIAAELQASQPRFVEFRITPELLADGDPDLLRAALFNLMDNACKFSSKSPKPVVQVGTESGAFFVRDNGAGFDMAYADKLFHEFSRLHDREEYPGSGIGLATVRRIVNRHGGEIWAKGEVGRGATFYFTLQKGERDGRKAPCRRPRWSCSRRTARTTRCFSRAR